jgi:hypothetical protein
MHTWFLSLMAAVCTWSWLRDCAWYAARCDLTFKETVCMFMSGFLALISACVLANASVSVLPLSLSVRQDAAYWIEMFYMCVVALLCFRQCLLANAYQSRIRYPPSGKKRKRLHDADDDEEEEMEWWQRG